MKSDTAVSDLIAVMALIAIFVTAAAIVGVALLSSPMGDAAPAMIARNETDENGSIFIYHDGGDPLEWGHFKILVDGVNRTGEFNLINATGEEYEIWTSWKAGEVLVNKTPLGAGSPRIQIVGEGVGRTGSDWLLHEIGDSTATGTTGTVTTTPTGTAVPTTEPTQIPLVADFTANITAGLAPLAVQFIDASTGEPTSWSWDFGDGNTSTEQNPVHTYAAEGTYTVTLNASNACGTASLTKPGYIQITEDSFINFIIDENVFVYGNTLKFSGNNINGPGATVVITGGLNTNDLNGGASIAVSDIYFDGAVTLDGGSADLGSPVQPGSIYVNGDLELWKGSRDIYGDVYVNGSFRLKDAKIHGNVYVNGDLTLDWTPTVAENARIYYTGTLTKPDNYDASILAKCIHQATVPGFTMPDEEIPPTKPADWYAARGYVPDGALTDGVKIFADSYTYTPKKGDLRAENVIVIARTGDIRIEKGGGCVTGIFFAPRGKVTFNGASLEGIVIARDGFFVTSGGTAVTFRNIEDCISNPEDYPF